MPRPAKENVQGSAGFKKGLMISTGQPSWVAERHVRFMEAFLVSFTTVALAEIGDRTQILALMLAARYRKPWIIMAAILAASLASHLAAGFLGVWLGKFLTPVLLHGIVGASLIVMGIWALKPDPKTEEAPRGKAGVFVGTLIAFFLAEMGDKTQIATMALAAGYRNVPLVVAGSTCAMLAVNAPAVFAGSAFASRVPVRSLNLLASGMFVVVGLIFLGRAIFHAVA